MKITGNEPAQASIIYDEKTSKPNCFTPGLTIRQHFAALAMQGLCSEGMFTDTTMQKEAEKYGSNISEAIAIAAVDLADALIAELNRKSE